MEAEDINGNTSLKRFVINRRDLVTNSYKPENAKNYLFVIGIDRYTFWPKLSNAVRDARDVVSILTEKYLFTPDETITIYNEEATRDNIYSELKKLIPKLTSNDNLLIYYSGHGHYDDLLNEGYWVPYNAKKSESQYVSNGDLMRVLGVMENQHTFLVVDACFSGSLFANKSRGFVKSSEGFIQKAEQYKSRWALASGRLETVSDGAYGSNSPFALRFMEFLNENADQNHFPVSELVQYVKVNVANDVRQAPLGNPLKSLGDEGGEFIFYTK